MKNVFYFIWFAILAICLFPFACIFMFLSIFNYDFFWKRVPEAVIDKLEKYHLI